MTETYADVIGQPQAVSMLQSAVTRPSHAYMFVGPPGVGQVEAAYGFAADLLANGDDDVRRRVLKRVHPDVLFVQRVGASILMAQMEYIIHEAIRTPIEANKKVLIIEDAHLIESDTRSAMLKILEEPPAGTIFILLADFVPSDLVTIASRCVDVPFVPLSDKRIAEALTNEGVPLDTAEMIVEAAGGRLDRAMQLISDDNLGQRVQLWKSIPSRLDGNGAEIVAIAVEISDLLSTSEDPIVLRHKAELKTLSEREKQSGARGSGRAELEKRQKRELRRARSDELCLGFALLTKHYRQRLVGSGGTDTRAVTALDAIAEANRALRFNPNESLLLQALLCRLESA